MGADARARFRIEGEDGTEAAFRSATKGAENAARKMRAEFDRATGGMISSVDRLRSQSAAVFAFIGGASIGTAVRALASARMEAERVSGALTVAAGSAEQAARQFQYVTGFSDQMGLSASETALAYARFAVSARGTALEGAKARDVFEAVAGASTALSLSADDTAGVLLALSQMISKGKVQAEELRGQLGERLPGAFQLAARAMGVTTSELDDMLKKGEVMAEDLLPKLATELDKTFGDQAVRAASGFTAEVNRLANAWERLKRAAGNSDSAKSLSLIHI
jgi:tape measure domain-containing protein